MAVETPTLFGQALRRREDPKFITGTGTFVDDVALPGIAYVAVLRSPFGHARIRSIDVDRARGLPGVRAVFTGQDVQAAGMASIPCGWSLPGMTVPPHPALALDRVRFQGDAVAAVVADTRGAAEDALERIDVDYEQLPAVVRPDDAVADGAPLVHDDIPNNVSFRWHVSGGDVARAFQEADRVVERRFVNQRLIPNALEPRGAMALYQPATGDLTMWTSSQIPHLVRLLLALTMSHPENHLRIISPDVGGAFGSKLYFYPEEALVAFLAKQLPGTPVKWIPGRSEEYQATTHGRDHVQDAAWAVMNDGTIVGARVTILANMGAYLSTFAPGIPTALCGLMMSGPYNIPNLECEVVGVHTNTVMVDAYRGAGRPEATFLIERMVESVADELGIDSIEVRRKNFIPSDAFPFTVATGAVYDSGNYQAALDKALQVIGYENLRQEQKLARLEGRYLGIGVSSYVEICGLAPSQVLGAVGGGAGGWESAEVRIHPTGNVTVYSGACWHGQGHDTGFAQIVASELGVPMDAVEVVHGDTERVQFGIGTFGSRSAPVGGTAVYMSVQKVKDKARKIAAHLLEANVEDVVYEGGKCYVKGSPDQAKTLAEISLAAYLAHNYPADLEPGLEATTFFDPKNFTFPFGTHISVVEVDRDTGKVAVLRYLAVDDCGEVINPLLKDGQVHGGIAQGIAQALFEEAVYNDDGSLVTGSMVDYAVPTAGELPMYETEQTVTPSPVNPLGVKGIGEAGTIASCACMANAVLDALKPFGVRDLQMPFSSEKVWRAMNQGGQR